MDILQNERNEESKEENQDSEQNNQSNDDKKAENEDNKDQAKDNDVSNEKKGQNGARSHVDGRYLSRADARSHRDRMRNSFLGQELSRPYLRTVCVYLSL